MPLAVMADELGPIENYQLREYDPGQPKPDQVRIAVQAAGVSFVDVLNATGKYQGKAPVPFIPGSECAGVIEAVGAEVEGFTVGQPVVASSWGGIFAEAINLSASLVDPMPAGMGYAEAAVFKVSATTAWHALVDRARLQSGETLLVLGAAGGTGYAAVQIGKYLGARVIASVSSEDKREMAQAGGADAVVDSGSSFWRQDVLAANNGEPVDVVFDPVGGPLTEAAFRSLAWSGRHLVVGFPAGIASLTTNLPLLKAASLMGVNLQKFSEAEPGKAQDNVRKLFALAEKGLFHPVVAHAYPLARFADAIRAVAEGRSAGRIVLVMD